MSTVKDNLWLWGQSPDGHYGANNVYRFPAPYHSRMTAMEGATFFDIPNCCRVEIGNHPVPPFDQESMAMDTLKQVVWSVVGAGNLNTPISERGTLDEVIRQAKMFPNITGGVFDDFFDPPRMAAYTPEKIAEMKQRLNNGAGRKLDLWVVYYEKEMYGNVDVSEHFKQFDVITFWTWFGKNLKDVAANIDRVREMAPGKRILAGCYLWDYGDKQPMDMELMKHQCDVYLDYMKQGKIEGIIVCSNCCADLGLETVPYMRQWIKDNGSIVL